MKLILNADDFGSTERHTRLIIDLLVNGKISSTTFLVNLPYSKEAITILQEKHPHLIDKLGLHFNLTEGSPLNPALENSPFVNADNQFQDFRGRVPVFRQMLHLGKLVQELSLQIELFHKLTGKYPTHIDSHGHTHCTWVVLLALLCTRAASKVPAIRLTRQYDHEPQLQIGLKNKLKRTVKKLLNFGFRLRFRAVAYFTDIRNIDGTWLSQANMEFMRRKFDSVEIMCHPYYFDESEYDFLRKEPNLFEQVEGLELLGYKDI